ncbi:Cdh1p [Malassezia vespertilionis]|uniref:Cdh1p n=1 Tax=Malassezia vespertilionis TaxID=2020962 RepID=A0A2N1JBC0_9BASI|nr:Cdh1p [Malassezia vespertilionis]
MYHSEFARRLRSQSNAGVRQSASTSGLSNSQCAGSSSADPLYDATSPGLPRAQTYDVDLTASRHSTRATQQAPLTPRKAKSKNSFLHGDRFIPSRDGSDLQAAFQLMSEDALTPGGRNKRKIVPDMDAQTEEANETYSMLLSSELFGSDAALCSSPSANMGIVSPSRSGTPTMIHSPTSASWSARGADSSLPTTPSKKNLLSFRSPTPSTTPSRSRDRRLHGSQMTPSSSGRLHESTSLDGLDECSTQLFARGATRSSIDAGLFGGLSVGGAGSPPGPQTSLLSTSEQIDSPAHTAYSTSPVKPESQRILLQSRKPARAISKVPYKVLDAPELADDFYLNLVDWSSQDLLSVGLGRCVYLWSAKNSGVSRLCQMPSMHDSITSVNFAERGNHLAIGTHSGVVQIWDTEKEKLLRTMMGHTARVGSLAWNNHVLTTGSRDRTIYHRDVRVPDHHVKTLRAHRQEVCGLKWNLTRELLASGGNDNKLFVWDGLRETPLHRFTEHTAAVKAIAWSPHQQGLLASGGGTADMKIRFWNTQTGALLNTMDTGSQVCNLAWNKSSNEIISTHGYSSGHIHNQVQLWRYPSLTQTATLTGHSMRVLYLAMSPNGKTIVTGAGDETLRFWDLNTPSCDTAHRRDDKAVHSSFVKLR